MKTTICGQPCSRRAAKVLAKLLTFSGITGSEFPDWAWQKITPEMLQRFAKSTSWKDIQKYRGAGAHTVRDLEAFFQSVGIEIPLENQSPSPWRKSVFRSGWYWWKRSEYATPEVVHVPEGFRPPEEGLWAGPIFPPAR
jgi:hypothetical protein